MSRILVTMGRAAIAAMLFCTTAQGTSAQGSEGDGGDVALRMVTFGGQEVAAVQYSPACPDGICPGLGNIFFLPAIDAQSVNTGGQVFLKNRRLGECAQLNSLGGRTKRDFIEAESMERLVQSQMAEANLHGSATTALLSVEGTVQAKTTYSSQIEERFSSVTIDITTATHSADLQTTSECFGPGAIVPDFLDGFEALAPIDPRRVSAPASWAPYVAFLRDQGSHIVMQQVIGSRFQQWESATSSSQDIQRTLKAKACAAAEGTSGTTGWSIDGCAGYDEAERKESVTKSTQSKRITLGGTEKTQQAVGPGKTVTKASLQDFIDSAQEATTPIRFLYKPIWEVLTRVYTRACANDGNGSPACQNLQRASTLQAAYEGWMAIGCVPLKSRTGITYQSMLIADTTTQGINIYMCIAEQTGCKNSRLDCHGGGFAYASCL